MHFSSGVDTLKKKTMRFDDLADFIKCYNPADRHKRKLGLTERRYQSADTNVTAGNESTPC
jgi:hypothetical protein